MLAVNMHETRTSLSNLVAGGEGARVIIARASRCPAAACDVRAEKRIGIAEGKFTVPNDIDAEIMRRFHGEEFRTP
jgi:hypothetical protein